MLNFSIPLRHYLIVMSMLMIYSIAFNPLSHLSVINFFPLLGVMFLVLVCSYGASQRKPLVISFSNPIKVYLILYFFLVFIAIISALFSEAPTLVASRVLLILIPAVVIVFFSKGLSENYSLIIGTLVVFAAVSALFSLAIFFLGEIESTENGIVQRLAVGPISLEQLVSYRGGVSTGVARFASFYSNPNYFARIILTAVPFLLALYFYGKISAAKFFLLAALFIFSFIVSDSRTSLLIAMAFVLLHLLFRHLILRKQRELVILISLLLVLVIFIINIAMVLFINDVVSFDQLLSGRTQAWNALASHIGEQPFRGVGFSVSSEVILTKEGVDFSAHNFYLAILAELGFLGYLIMLLTFIFPVACFKISDSLSLKTVELKIATLLSILALYTHQILEVGILSYGVTNILFIIMCVFLVRSSESGANA